MPLTSHEALRYGLRLRLNLNPMSHPENDTPTAFAAGRRRLGTAAAAALLAFSASPANAAQPGLPPAERRVALMGTTLQIAVRMPRRDDALAASERAIAEIRRVEDLLTTWRDSPLARLNGAPVGVDFAIDSELSAILSTVFAWSSRTDGAFDPTVAPLVAAWGLRGTGRIPSPGELEAALRATGPNRFRLDPGRASAVRLDAGAGIDEGAWGKGYALDRAGERLRAAGALDALLDFGGQILALGRGVDGRGWTAEVSHPRHRERPVAVLSFSDLSLSTSGNSERALEVRGRRIGHLLDPHRGEPAPDFGAVTVAAPSALVADILSTAFFVLGPTRGLELSELLRREGVPQETLFLLDNDAGLRALASPGFSRLVVSADPSLRGLAPATRASRRVP